MDLALLILRLVVGLLMIGHGGQKLFGWFKGVGMQGFTGWVGSMGFRPAHVWAWLGALAEFGGGLLFALGLFSPLGSLGIVASQLTAITKVHWPKIWNTENGIEFPLTNLAVAVAVGIAGPGAISLDAMSGTQLPGWLATLATIVVVAGWIIGLLISGARPQQSTTASTR